LLPLASGTACRRRECVDGSVELKQLAFCAPSAVASGNARACAQNEAYLIAIRSGDNSMAAVRAIQVLEGLADTEVARPSNTAPGIVLRLVTVVQDAKAAAPPAIEAKVIAASD
jgi:hypothetical protein